MTEPLPRTSDPEGPPLTWTSLPPSPPLVGPPPSFSAAARPEPSRKVPHHPAGRARKVAAGISVAAFAALVGGIAVGATDPSSPSSPAATSTDRSSADQTTADTGSSDGSPGATSADGRPTPPGAYGPGARTEGDEGWGATPPSAGDGTATVTGPGAASSQSSGS